MPNGSKLKHRHVDGQPVHLVKSNSGAVRRTDLGDIQTIEPMYWFRFTDYPEVEIPVYESDVSAEEVPGN